MIADDQDRLLLDDLIAELVAVRKSLSGRSSGGPAELYIFHCVSQIAALLDGYVCLRRAKLWQASKHLIRPAIESVFRIHAVRSSPETFYQIAFSELKEDKKLARSGPPSESGLVVAQLEAHWTLFKEEYSRACPNHSARDQEVSYWELARIGGLEGYYSTYYRFYSQFTHGALRATSGSLSEFETEDDPTMSLCALSCIDALVSIGAVSPGLDALKKRFPTDGCAKA